VKALKFLAIPALALAAGSISVAQTTGTTQEPQSAEKALPASSPGPAWPEEPRWTGPGPMPRHYLITRWGIPEPYTSMTNPLPRKHAILKRGKAVYKEHCASCHGDQGAGDGEAGRDLDPGPGNLVWLSDVPEKQWDAYMYWATAEGGIALGTAMPAYKDTLSSDDIWAVTAYIQANLPFVSQWRFF